MSRESNLVKNTFILSIGTFLPKLTALISMPIITGHLTKAEYGTYDLLSTLVSLLLPIVTLQIHSAAFRFLIDCRNDDNSKNQIISSMFFFVIPITVLSLTIVYFCLYHINIQTRVLIVLFLFADIMIITVQQIVRGLSHNLLYSLSSVIQSICNMLLIIFTVAYNGLGLNGVLVSFILATTTGIIVLFFGSGIYKCISLSNFSFDLLKNLLRYSWPMIPNTLSNWILSVSDRMILTFFMGIEAVAVYGVANKIPLLFSVIQGTFIFAWQENASLALKDQDVDKYYSDMFDSIFSILSGIMSILIGITPILFMFLIKGDYADSYPHMPILFMAMFASALSAFLGGIYVAHKRTKSVGLTTILAAITNLAIDLMFIKTIGIYAASISTLLSYSFLSIFRMIDIKTFQQIKYNHRKNCICVLVLIIMCVFCWINKLTLNIINTFIGFTFSFYVNKSIIFALFKGLKKKFLIKG